MTLEVNLERGKHIFRCPDFRKIVDEAVDFLCTSPVHLLPPASPFEDAGVYSLYYKGNLDIYSQLAEINSTNFVQPIYVGKAVPRGWRTSRNTKSAEIPCTLD